MRQAVAATVVLVAPDEVLSPGWVTFADGVVDEVGAGPPPSDAAVVARGDVVIPGLVSAHQHTADLLVAGGPTGPTFLDWLLGTYHGGLALAGPDDCAAAVAAVRAATLEGGVTTMVDCWSAGPVDDTVRDAECAHAALGAHRASGGRTLFAVMSNERPAPAWRMHALIDPERLCRPVEDWLVEVGRLASIHHRSDGGRTLVTLSPELPETTSPAGLMAAWGLAGTLGTVLPIHLCASEASRAAYGPAELERDGLAEPGLLAAHHSTIDEAEAAALGAKGIGVAHCPRSSRALGATRLTPVGELRRSGARCGLGLDNASLNPSRDLFAEARAAIEASVVAEDPLRPADALAMLTAEGASAAGLGGVVGELRPGWRADLVVLDASGPHWWPRRATWDETVVMCATAADVRTVLVDGRVVVTGGVAVTRPDGPALDRAAHRIATEMGWR